MTQVIFLVLNEDEYLDDILTAFVEAGITGATIISSIGMGRAIATDAPIFAAVRQILASQHSDVNNVTIITVVKDEAQVEKVISIVEKFINLDEPGTGILFVMPVTQVKGLSAGKNSL